MNNITNGLEFMQEEELNLLPKLLFLIGSFVLFFVFLFALGNHHAKAKCSRYYIFCLRAAAIGAAFTALMLLLRTKMAVNIALTVVFVFMEFGMIFWYGRKIDMHKSTGIAVD